MASENRVGSKEFDTKTFTQTATNVTLTKGEIFGLDASENIMAFALEAIGTAGASRSPSFPGGNTGAVCIASELCVLDKNTGSPVAINEKVFYDNAVDANGVIGTAETTTSGAVTIGITEEAATTSDATVLVSLYDAVGPVK